MRVRSAAATTLASRPDAEPIFFAVLEFTAPRALTLRLSDRFIAKTATTDECLPLVQGWGTIEEPLDPVTGGGSPSTFDIALANDVPVAGRDRFSDLLYSPRNPLGYVFEFAKCSVYRFDADLGVEAAELLGVFYLEDPTELSEDVFSLRMSDVTLVLEGQSALTVITRDVFPQAPEALLGTAIPRPIGALPSAPLLWVIDGAVGALAGALDDVTTSFTVTGASRFTSLRFQIDAEIIVATTREGDVFSGCTRASLGTTAAAHEAAAAVYEALDSYLALLGEHDGRFRPGALTNIRVGGAPVRTSPAVEADITTLIAGKHFTGVRFTAADVAIFHALIGGSLAATVANLTLTADATDHLSGIRTIPVPAGAEFGRTTRTIAFTLNSPTNHGASAVQAYRRLVGGGAWKTLLFADPQVSGWSINVTDSETYETADDEEIKITGLIPGAALVGQFRMVVHEYTVAAADSGGGGSTALQVIGEVTADVIGILDDADGTITGTPLAPLVVPADVTELLVRCYPTAVEFDPRWDEARAAQDAAGLRWAMLFGGDGPVAFSDLRQLIGKQSRSVLSVEAGLMLLRYMDDAPPIDLPLDYRRNVWDQAPAVAIRSARTQLFNRVLVHAQPDYAGDAGFRYVTRLQDLAQPGLATPTETTLELPWVQDSTVADRLGAFWLAWWKRPRLQVDLVAWQELIALERGDAIGLASHPVLEAHGGSALPFRVFKKGYLIGSENPSRISLSAIEAILSSAEVFVLPPPVEEEPPPAEPIWWDDTRLSGHWFNEYL